MLTAPTFTPGRILVLTVALATIGAPGSGVAQTDPSYVLTVEGASAPSGETVDVRILLDNLGVDLVGWSWGVCQESGALDPVAVILGESIITANGGGPPDFENTAIHPGEGWTIGCVLDLTFRNVLPPAAGYEMNVATYELLAPDGTTTTLELCESLGDPAVEILLVDADGNPHSPVQNPGQIVIDGPAFRRGDADGDGSVIALADGVFMLNYFFVPPSPTPPCLEAADVDDSGTLNGLSDTITLLNYVFVPGSPPPPPPGPERCGFDPTDDLLTCEDSVCP